MATGKEVAHLNEKIREQHIHICTHMAKKIGEALNFTKASARTNLGTSLNTGISFLPYACKITHAHTRTDTCAHAHTPTRTHMDIRHTHTRTYTYTNTHRHKTHTHAHTYTHMHKHIYAQLLLAAAEEHPRGGAVFERLSQDLQAATTAQYPAAWGTMVRHVLTH